MRHRQPVTYWEPSYLSEIESLVPTDGAIIHSLGGSGYVFRSPKSLIYIDPYLAGDPLQGIPGMHRTIAVPIDPAGIRVADAVLVTHEHYDHCQEDTLLAIAAGTSAPFIGPTSAVTCMKEFGVPAERIIQVEQGGRFVVGDITIQVWKGHDPNEPHALLYLLETQGLRFLFTGDSFTCPAFAEIATQGTLDTVQLSFGREFYMSEAETLDAAALLCPRVLLPCHWEIWRGHTGDILEFGRLVERRRPPFDVVILSIGDRLHYQGNRTYAKAP